jgi:hypothetical protein
MPRQLDATYLPAASQSIMAVFIERGESGVAEFVSEAQGGLPGCPGWASPEGEPNNVLQSWHLDGLETAYGCPASYTGDPGSLVLTDWNPKGWVVSAGGNVSVPPDAAMGDYTLQITEDNPNYPGPMQAAELMRVYAFTVVSGGAGSSGGGQVPAGNGNMNTVEQEIPPGWTELVTRINKDATRIGRLGRWTVNVNDPLSVWGYRAVYTRGEYEPPENYTARIDELHNFFLNWGISNAFLVEDIYDFRTSDRLGSGHVEFVTDPDGVAQWRLTKHYPAPYGNGNFYRRLITRPRADTLTFAGNSGPIDVDYQTGIVTGFTEPGTWDGEFRSSCIFMENSLELTQQQSGEVTVVVTLEENLEV